MDQIHFLKVNAKPTKYLYEGLNSLYLITMSKVRNYSSNYNNYSFCSLKNMCILSVRKLSKMTESMSKAMLSGVGIATGSVMGPMVRSQAGKTFFSMVPGEVLLASLDAVSKSSIIQVIN